MQTNSSLLKKNSRQLGHRRTHSSSDYDITKISAKNHQTSPKMSKSPEEHSETSPRTSFPLGFQDPVKQSKKQDSAEKEYIIEPLEMTAEQQRIQAGNAKFNKENLNFGKNMKNPSSNFCNSFSQLFTHSTGNKETVAEKYKKQLEDQKISTIIEKNDILSNEDSSFIDMEKLSPINRNSSDCNKLEFDKRPSFRKKKFHSNSQDLNIGKNLVNCGQRLFGNPKNTAPKEQQVFTIHLKDPNRNEKQLDKILHFLKEKKKIPEINLQDLHSKKIGHSISSVYQNQNLGNSLANQSNLESTVKNLEKRIFRLEQEVIGLKSENTKIKETNSNMVRKLKDLGVLEGDLSTQV